MEKNVYKAACKVINRALRNWAIEIQGGVEFTNYVEGVLALADELVGAEETTENADACGCHTNRYVSLGSDALMELAQTFLR